MAHEYPLTCLAPTIAGVLGLPAPSQATGEPIAQIVSSMGPAQRLAVLAPDALGWFPFSKWRHEMPFLDSLHRRQSILLRSVMPTITPVNFATMVAGADQSVHGIAAFGDEFQCETLFDVVRAAASVSAGVGQPGWTGSELLGRCADIWGKADSNCDDDVESAALTIAREHKPRFIIVQIGETDSIFHKHGPSSAEVAPAIRRMDRRLRRMVGQMLPLGYAIVINSDHGQHDTETGGSHGTDSDEDALVPCTWLRADETL